MAPENAVDVVRALFAAIERGDIATALTLVAEDVDWLSPATRHPPPDFAWAGRRTRPAEIAEFFKQLGSAIELGRMELHHVATAGGKVFIEGSNGGTVRATGKRYDHDWVMVFTVTDGRIVALRHYYDPSEVMVAFRR